MNSKKEIGIILTVSSLISAFLVWFIYFKSESGNRPEALGQLPMMNAICNAISAVCLVNAFRFIKKGNKQLHVLFICLALFFSAVFLVGYLTYHHYIGDTKFTNTGMIKYPYFFILITHILASILILPLIMFTLLFAIKKNFESHRKFAKITFPLWLYVSVTGVAIFLMLKYLNTPIPI